MSDHLPDVELTAEQEARAKELWLQFEELNATELRAARLIVHLQDALRSIARSTCCGSCQEAKLVAVAALSVTTGDGAK